MPCRSSTAEPELPWSVVASWVKNQSSPSGDQDLAGRQALYVVDVAEGLERGLCRGDAAGVARGVADDGDVDSVERVRRRYRDRLGQRFGVLELEERDVGRALCLGCHEDHAADGDLVARPARAAGPVLLAEVDPRRYLLPRHDVDDRLVALAGAHGEVPGDVLVRGDYVLGDQPAGPALAQPRVVSKLKPADRREPCLEPRARRQQPRSHLL